MGKKQETVNMVEVMVGGRKTFVPQHLTVGDLKIAGNIPLDRSLIAQSGNRRLILRDSEVIKPETGDIFSDIPPYIRGSNEERFLLEVYLLEQIFGSIKYDQEDRLWVCIPNFDLPQGYNKKTSQLLIELPAHYPFNPPRNFFLDRTIGTRNGKDIEHYYPNSEQNKYYDKGWAWFSVHIQRWKVKDDIMRSDNLLTSVDIAYLTLQDLVN